MKTCCEYHGIDCSNGQGDACPCRPRLNLMAAAVAVIGLLVACAMAAGVVLAVLTIIRWAAPCLGM